MNIGINMYSEFFYRPLWQQYLLVTLLISLTSVVSYLFFIKERVTIVKQYQQQFNDNQSEIERLEKTARLNKRSAEKQVTFISESAFADLLRQHNLRLLHLKYSENSTNQTVDVLGDYHHFLTFLNQLVEEKRYLAIHQLVIEKNSENLLQFTLTLSFHHKENSEFMGVDR